MAVMSAFAVTGVVASLHSDLETPSAGVEPTAAPLGSFGGEGADARAWFRSVRQHCNPVEVETQLRRQPAPPTAEGGMHEAACYALAGRTDRARQVIEALEPELRYQAAGVVFEAGHPAADAGDDVAAGPLMELVVEYWPNHYMALYHAGAARFESGSYAAAARYLERFLVEYAVEDGWRSSAISMLERMERQ
jgi:tetratricopeptide (TPR) repeat protein